MKYGFPAVDLGYAIHAPTYINVTDSGLKIAGYNNIRFAEPPTGALRFRKPKTPPPQSPGGIQDGSEYPSTDCVSSAPVGIPIPGIDGNHWGQEDCLFLNVHVPEGVKPGDDVPVVHWIFGSAYAFGSKDNDFTSVDPVGLLGNVEDGGEKVIFVASNYRLGLYGWMSSPYEESMDANVGLHDGLAAVEWTKQYISRFGGDPERITVIGQSAGAGIINLMLTADGGKGELPFSQAVISSSSLMPRRHVESGRQEVYEMVLEASNCTDLQCLLDATPQVLDQANNHLIAEVPTGTGGASFGPGIGFSPVVDGTTVPDEPMVLLSQGNYHKEIKQVLTSNMEYEGMGLSSDENMPQAFPELVRINFPTASNETIERIKALFPYPPELPEKLAWDWITSIVYACHGQSIAKAYGDKARRYVMTIPPAIHGQDLSYLFFINNATTPVSNVEVARQTQSYFMQFIRGEALQEWPTYGTEFNIMDISEDGFEVKPDPWETSDICPTLFEVVMDPENGN
ncbi:hypothetical protein FQN54_002703 [Arachnomyces sp. PD_36]|nr:hypothetical protein FQN54_002703 [Arachnomyces sp. PD_36]